MSSFFCRKVKFLCQNVSGDKPLSGSSTAKRVFTDKQKDGNLIKRQTEVD